MGQDGSVTLREAIQAANTNTSVDGSEVGNGADTIKFDPTLDGATINLEFGDGESGDMDITESLVIDGGTTNITIDATHPSNKS